MEDYKTGHFNPLDEDESPPAFSDLSKTDASLLDMDNFEKLEATINASAGDLMSSQKDPMEDFGFQSRLSSTNRPLVTSSEEDLSERSQLSADPVVNLSEYVNIEKDSDALLDFGADTGVEESKRDPSDGDQLLIGLSTSRSKSPAEDTSPHSFGFERREPEVSLPKIKDPKIVAKSEAELDNYEVGPSAYKAAAQPTLTQQSEAAMDSEKVGTSNSECECPFSPAALFNPDKLHPEVAEYVYWRDPKKSAIALTGTLVFLLSFKFFSVISVAAYLILALLCVTISFRIYKNVLQAIQKSNEGHPFKEYLEMDIAISQDMMGETLETCISHLNCVTGKLRSLILVEDLVDTLKLAVLAWCLTCVGAWFNGLTLVILGVVAAFTLPKVYETNKAQIDVYAELVRTKGKEVIEMVNAKMPMGKKKKEQ